MTKWSMHSQSFLLNGLCYLLLTNFMQYIFVLAWVQWISFLRPLEISDQWQLDMKWNTFFQLDRKVALLAYFISNWVSNWIGNRLIGYPISYPIALPGFCSIGWRCTTHVTMRQRPMVTATSLTTEWKNTLRKISIIPEVREYQCQTGPYALVSWTNLGEWTSKHRHTMLSH